MAKHAEFESPYESPVADWPHMTWLADGGIRLHGRLPPPGFRKSAYFWYVVTAVFATPGGGAWMSVYLELPDAWVLAPVLLLALLFWALWKPVAKPLLEWTAGNRIDLRIYPDRIELWDKAERAFKKYKPDHITEWRVETHSKAVDEEMKEVRTGRRQRATYRNALEIVMQYGFKRITIAELDRDDGEKAATFVLKAQAAIARIEQQTTQGVTRLISPSSTSNDILR